jgi:signal transduction histidine kinase
MEEVAETALDAPSVFALGDPPLPSAIESEVKRWLARELHDSVIQALSVVVLEMEQFRIGRRRPRQEAHQLEHLQAVAREVLANLRDTVEELRGEASAEDQLVPCVSKAVARLQQQAGITATLSIAPSWPGSLPRSLSRNLYRVIEEALNNVRAHSGATQVTVSMWTAGRSAIVSVQDDGLGFEAVEDEMRPFRGLGMIGMKERALLVGGSLRVDSGGGKGTKLSLTFPLPEHA